VLIKGGEGGFLGLRSFFFSLKKRRVLHPGRFLLKVVLGLFGGGSGEVSSEGGEGAGS